MNREILFRGKDDVTGEWVYGYSVDCTWYLNEQTVSIIVPKDMTLYPRCEISHYNFVDTETVGQLAGFKDKNGIDVFEGDVVRYKECWGFAYDTLLSEHVAESDKYIVVEAVVACRDGEFTPRPKRVDCEDYWYSFGCCDFEVIGNIHDNPELVN